MTPVSVCLSQDMVYPVSFSEPRSGDGAIVTVDVTSFPSAFFGLARCAFLLLPHSSRLAAALVITALSAGFDATHPLMSSITTSLDPKHRGQITGFATFANFMGMGAGALLFQHLIAFGFSTALAIFASVQTLLGLAALYGFRRERPSRIQSVELSTT